MLDVLLAYAEPVLAAPTPQAASRAYFASVEPIGATYLQTRLYRRPRTPLTPRTHWAAGGFVERIARPGWEGSEAFNYICFQQVPTLRAVEEGRTRYRFGDFAPHHDKRYGAYWDAMSEAGMAEVLCASAYGPGRSTGSLHLGFDRRDFGEAEAAAIQTAGMMLVEKLLTFEIDEDPEPPIAAPLTPRERDALAFVAQGKTDWEIATILGISQTTARSHVDNARRKLGAVNRAHAVARLLAGGSLS
ncbi:LuxR C-terminal-related transcriptional regulator [Sphingomonas sp.]|uniref:helix-turn-helix transcriptional regulator n=1 Tax=Sphingomonas sp. TaxID=28214 RepID=UPI001B2ACA76|nr:LuxR C-terminal-related transcriptional regulator [Sphingomonas sp.]MBO9712569.1 helix-turn-helix transcriptional regulator [Sphingomonas sp.]